MKVFGLQFFFTNFCDRLFRFSYMRKNGGVLVWSAATFPSSGQLGLFMAMFLTIILGLCAGAMSSVGVVDGFAACSHRSLCSLFPFPLPLCRPICVLNRYLAGVVYELLNIIPRFGCCGREVGSSPRGGFCSFFGCNIMNGCGFFTTTILTLCSVFGCNYRGVILP